MFGLGSTELLIILLLVVVFFGAKRLPEIGKALGRMGSDFKSGKEAANPGAGQDTQSQESPTDSSPDSGLDIEAEIKNQLISRMPGLGQLNKIKRTAEMVGRVADVAGKTGGKRSGDKKDS
jgi:sec-independent protein translocase protein TatA